MSYLALKTLHILSSAVLFGAGLGMGYFLWMAVRSRDATTVANTLRQVIRAEWWFIIPMVVLQPITGVLLMDMLGYSHQSDWFRWVMGGYSLLGVVWLPVFLIQYRLQKMLAESGAHALEQQRFARLFTWWSVCSVLMYLGAIGLFVLMVYKPGLAVKPDDWR